MKLHPGPLTVGDRFVCVADGLVNRRRYAAGRPSHPGAWQHAHFAGLCER